MVIFSSWVHDLKTSFLTYVSQSLYTPGNQHHHQLGLWCAQSWCVGTGALHILRVLRAEQHPLRMRGSKCPTWVSSPHWGGSNRCGWCFEHLHGCLVQLFGQEDNTGQVEYTYSSSAMTCAMCRKRNILSGHSQWCWNKGIARINSQMRTQDSWTHAHAGNKSHPHRTCYFWMLSCVKYKGITGFLLLLALYLIPLGSEQQCAQPLPSPSEHRVNCWGSSKCRSSRAANEVLI